METIYEKNSTRHEEELDAEDIKARMTESVVNNKKAAMQINWRKTPFPERMYERLSSTNVICSGLSPVDQRSAENELQTALPNSFVGLPYDYDDVGQSENWMKSVGGVMMMSHEKKAAAALAKDGGVVRAQVETTMQMLLIAVQDRVMTQEGVLERPELISRNWCEDLSRHHADTTTTTLDASRNNNNKKKPELSEQPVWGIDSFTRGNVVACIETHEEYKEHADEFLEKWLLPAINACPVELAHDLTSAARILEGSSAPTLLKGSNNSNSSASAAATASSSSTSNTMTFLSEAFSDKVSRGPHWLSGAARQLRLACEILGDTAFRVHPKGHGAVVLKKDGIKADTLVTYYRGEVYPPWRWGEKQDAIEEIQEQFGLRPVLPDFYNMVLERPRVDPRGYGLLFVDASRKAGMGSSLSHSCYPTCQVHVAAQDGKLCLAMTTVRDVEQGEELTFDYCAVTESLNEYNSAICLCGHTKCRWSFLHHATADQYQQVLSRNSPIAVRVASLIRASNKKVMSSEDNKALKRHGFHTATFGAVSFFKKEKRLDQQEEATSSIENVPVWLRTYAADVLRYIEYERRGLPSALICNTLNNSMESDNNKNNKKKQQELLQSMKQKNSTTTGTSSNKKNAYFYFLRVEYDSLEKIVRARHQAQQEEEGGDQQHLMMNQQDLSVAIKRLAGETWKKMDDSRKEIYIKFCSKESPALDATSTTNSKNNENLEDSSDTNNNNNNKKGGGRKKVNKKKTGNNKKDEKRSNSSNDSVTGDENASDSGTKSVPISFRDADIAGRTLLEQRIQSLVQILSRCGRILARHRDSHAYDEKDKDDDNNNNINTNGKRCSFQTIHSPISILSDKEVVKWMWSTSSEDGVLAPLLKFGACDPCVSSSLKSSFDKFRKKYKLLDVYCGEEEEPFDRSTNHDSTKDSTSIEVPSDTRARKMLKEALLEMRQMLVDGIEKSDIEVEEYYTNKRKQNRKRGSSLGAKTKRENKKKKQQKKVTEQNNKDKKNVSTTITTSKAALQNKKEDLSKTVFNMFSDDSSTEDDTVVAPTTIERCPSALSSSESTFSSLMPAHSACCDESAALTTTSEQGGESDESQYTWSPEEYEKHKYKLETAADLILLYANTNTFFKVPPYIEVESSPIEVYARELGNQVPKSILPPPPQQEGTTQSSGTTVGKKPVKNSRKTSRQTKKEYCDPEDVVGSVTRKYSSSHVFIQLLQWYNSGIGTRTDIPEMSGCAHLPRMEDCFINKTVLFLGSQSKSGSKSSNKNKDTYYCTHIRRKLAEWIVDWNARSNPWSEELRQFFSCPFKMLSESKDDTDFSKKILGSPVLDFLMQGDDTNINNVFESLEKSIKGKVNVPKNSNHRHHSNHHPDDGDTVMTTEDSEVVLKSTVDMGKPAQAKVTWVQCENPECQKWRKIPFHVDVDLLPAKFYCKDNLWSDKNSCEASEDEWENDKDEIIFDDEDNDSSNDNDDGFKLNTRFDVKNSMLNKYIEAIVVQRDFKSAQKRIKFHFPELKSSKADEWVNMDSNRIKPHGKYTGIKMIEKSVAVPTAHNKPSKPIKRKRSSSVKKEKENSNTKEKKGIKKAIPNDCDSTKSKPSKPIKRKRSPSVKKTKKEKESNIKKEKKGSERKTIIHDHDSDDDSVCRIVVTKPKKTGGRRRSKPSNHKPSSKPRKSQDTTSTLTPKLPSLDNNSSSTLPADETGEVRPAKQTPKQILSAFLKPTIPRTIKNEGEEEEEEENCLLSNRVIRESSSDFTDNFECKENLLQHRSDLSVDVPSKSTTSAFLNRAHHEDLSALQTTLRRAASGLPRYGSYTAFDNHGHLGSLQSFIPNIPFCQNNDNVIPSSNSEHYSGNSMHTHHTYDSLYGNNFSAPTPSCSSGSTPSGSSTAPGMPTSSSFYDHHHSSFFSGHHQSARHLPSGRSGSESYNHLNMSSLAGASNSQHYPASHHHFDLHNNMNTSSAPSIAYHPSNNNNVETYHPGNNFNHLSPPPSSSSSCGGYNFHQPTLEIPPSSLHKRNTEDSSSVENTTRRIEL